MTDGVVVVVATEAVGSVSCVVVVVVVVVVVITSDLHDALEELDGRNGDVNLVAENCGCLLIY
jgi:hypothetical protein